MSDAQCLHCGGKIAVSRKHDGSPGFLGQCDDCGVGIWLGEGWGEEEIIRRLSRRTPGPATAKMLEHLSNRTSIAMADWEAMRSAFLAEHAARDNAPACEDRGGEE